eukprot:1188251-Prorocentrum_minimum.AAC.2
MDVLVCTACATIRGPVDTIRNPTARHGVGGHEPQLSRPHSLPAVVGEVLHLNLRVWAFGSFTALTLGPGIAWSPRRQLRVVGTWISVSSRSVSRLEWHGCVAGVRKATRHGAVRRCRT